MQYVPFGPTGMHVSRLSLGTMTFANTLDENDAAGVIDEALDQGVNLIDTADSYGEAEACLGRCLDPGKRERVFLVSKVFRQRCRDKRVGRNSRTNVLDSLHRSLRQMKTDYLDAFLLHHPDPDTPIEQTLKVMDDAVRQGKLRHWGVSNHYAWQVSYMLGLCRDRGLEPPTITQNCYSIIERQLEVEYIPMLKRFGLGLMCYSPLSGGILTGKYHPESGEPESGRADKAKNFRQRAEKPEVAKCVGELRRIAESQGLAMNQLAIAWLLARDAASTIVLGGSKPEHFTSVYEVADTALPEDVVERIDELSDGFRFTPYMNQPFKAGGSLNPNG